MSEYTSHFNLPNQICTRYCDRHQICRSSTVPGILVVFSNNSAEKFWRLYPTIWIQEEHKSTGIYFYYDWMLNINFIDLTMEVSHNLRQQFLLQQRVNSHLSCLQSISETLFIAKLPTVVFWEFVLIKFIYLRCSC